MPKVALIQFRTEKAVLDRELDNIIAKTGLSKGDIAVYNALFENLNYLDVKHYDGFIFGGSGEVTISNNCEKVALARENVAPLFNRVIEADVPTLCICLGHQLLSESLGAPVERSDEKSEVGTVMLQLTADGKSDPIFNGLEDGFRSLAAHNDSVGVVPPGAVLLAENGTCQVQAIRYKSKVYGVQFHPELEKESFEASLNSYPQYKDGRNIHIEDVPHVWKVLQNFIGLLG